MTRTPGRQGRKISDQAGEMILALVMSECYLWQVLHLSKGMRPSWRKLFPMDFLANGPYGRKSGHGFFESYWA
jgi:hypothetical protein